MRWKRSLILDYLQRWSRITNHGRQIEKQVILWQTSHKEHSSHCVWERDEWKLVATEVEKELSTSWHPQLTVSRESSSVVRAFLAPSLPSYTRGRAAKKWGLTKIHPPKDEESVSQSSSPSVTSTIVQCHCHHHRIYGEEGQTFPCDADNDSLNWTEKSNDKIKDNKHDCWRVSVSVDSGLLLQLYNYQTTELYIPFQNSGVNSLRW